MFYDKKFKHVFSKPKNALITSFSRFFINELVKDSCLFFVLYVASDLNRVILYAFIFSIFQNACLWFDYKRFQLNEINGFICIDKRSCDIDILRFGIWSSVKLSYMEGPYRRVQRLPRTAFSASAWKKITECQT